METLLREISIAISHYKDNCTKYSIDSLLKLQDRLSVDSYYLADVCSESREIKDMTEYNYNTSVIQAEYEYTTKGDAVLKSKTKSKFDNVDKQKAFLEKENEYKRLKLLLNQINKILASINQRVSYLKLELNKTI